MSKQCTHDGAKSKVVIANLISEALEDKDINDEDYNGITMNNLYRYLSDERHNVMDMFIKNNGVKGNCRKNLINR